MKNIILALLLMTVTSFGATGVTLQNPIRVSVTGTNTISNDAANPIFVTNTQGGALWVTNTSATPFYVTNLNTNVFAVITNTAAGSIFITNGLTSPIYTTNAGFTANRNITNLIATHFQIIPAVSSGAYSTNQIMGVPITLTNFVATQGLSSTIYGVTVKDYSLTFPAFDIFVLGGAVAGTYTNKTIPVITDLNLPAYKIAIATTDYSPLGACGIASPQITGKPLKINSGANATILCISRNTADLAAATNLVITLFTIPDAGSN